MVQRGALETVRRDRVIPVLVDHDKTRQVGTVRELSIFLDVTGGVVRDWYYAHCELTDDPSRLKRGGGVSWAWNPLQEQDVNGTTRILRGLITEVSILSPSTQPAEPQAGVAWVGESPRSVADLARSEVIVHKPDTRLVRHGIGQVLGVRCASSLPYDGMSGGD